MKNTFIYTLGGLSIVLFAGCAGSPSISDGALGATAPGSAASISMVETEKHELSIPLYAELARGEGGQYQFVRFATGRPTGEAGSGHWVRLQAPEFLSDEVLQAASEIPDFSARLLAIDAVYVKSLKTLDRLRSAYHNSPLPIVRWNIDYPDGEQGESIQAILDEKAESVLPRAQIAFNKLPAPFEHQISLDQAGYRSFDQLEQSAIRRISQDLETAAKLTETVRLQCSDPEVKEISFSYKCPKTIPTGLERVVVDLLVES
ncbi:hypothetical protein [Marinobacter lutaoensis]|nr:hypothetical protein [Marinobacter lutaoensis]